MVVMIATEIDVMDTSPPHVPRLTEHYAWANDMSEKSTTRSCMPDMPHIVACRQMTPDSALHSQLPCAPPIDRQYVTVTQWQGQAG